MYLLADLWHDCLSSENRQPKEGSEYWGLVQSMQFKRERIMSELSKEGQEMFEAFERAQNTIANLREEDTCIRAFRLGAKMMVDVLGDYSSPFRN